MIRRLPVFFKISILLLVQTLFSVHTSFSAVLYKQYLVRKNNGTDILCEQYTIQKDDYILKLMRSKGEISQNDFPQFLNIFKRFNPDVRNVDRVTPGQRVLIPLRTLEPDSFPGQSSGVVMIPFVTISSIPELLKEHSEDYLIERGDCVSLIVEREFGRYGSREYRKGLEVFKVLNPDIADINHIRQGQHINLPKADLAEQIWYEGLFDENGRFIEANLPPEQDSESVSEPPAPRYKNKTDIMLHQVAEAASGEYLNNGYYYLPGVDGQQVKIDLSRFPLMDFGNGKKALFCKDENLTPEDQSLISNVSALLSVIPFSDQSSLGEVMGDLATEIYGQNGESRNAIVDINGLHAEVFADLIIQRPPFADKPPRQICVTTLNNYNQRTPDSVISFLAQHNVVLKEFVQGKYLSSNTVSVNYEANNSPVLKITGKSEKEFAAQFVQAINYNYTSNVQFTFPYAGTQVSATSSMASNGRGKEVMIDYGDIYGDAVSAIEKTHLGIIQILKSDDRYAIIRKILNGLKIDYKMFPTIAAADSRREFNVTFTFSGILINDSDGSYMVTNVDLPAQIVDFLQNDKGIRVLNVM